MALKLLVFMSIWQLALSVPDPDPYNINVDVEQVVNFQYDNCCPARVIPYGYCEYGGTTFQPYYKIEVSCFILECQFHGYWEYKGKINQTCGECQVFGDPQILTFDKHNPSGLPSVHPRWYTFQGVGTYMISRFGYVGYPYVTSKFEPEPSGRRYTAPRNVCYYQHHVNGPSYWKFCAELPPLASTSCYKSTANPTLCGIKVTVEDYMGVITDYNSLDHPSMMYNPRSGPVFVFNHNHIGSAFNNQNVQCLNIVGSEGLSVSLCTSTMSSPFGRVISTHSNLYVWAAPNLKGTLYGLCDTYTGKIKTEYTTKEGDGTTTINLFATSWIDPNPHVRRRRDLGQNGDTTEFNSTSSEVLHGRRHRRTNICVNPTTSAAIDVTCNTITTGGCGGNIPTWKCEIFKSACVYDLCRVTDQDHYEKGYANHLLIEDHLDLDL